MPKRPLCNHIDTVKSIRFALVVSFAVISIPIPSKSVEKKIRSRNHPQHPTRKFRFFRIWEAIGVAEKRPYCDHPTTILSCRIALVVSFVDICIPTASKSVGYNRRRRNHPRHPTRIIFVFSNFTDRNSSAKTSQLRQPKHYSKLSDRFSLVIGMMVDNKNIIRMEIEINTT